MFLEYNNCSFKDNFVKRPEHVMDVSAIEVKYHYY